MASRSPRNRWSAQACSPAPAPWLAGSNRSARRWGKGRFCPEKRVFPAFLPGAGILGPGTWVGDCGRSCFLKAAQRPGAQRRASCYDSAWTSARRQQPRLLHLNPKTHVEGFCASLLRDSHASALGPCEHARPATARAPTPARGVFHAANVIRTTDSIRVPRRAACSLRGERPAGRRGRAASRSVLGGVQSKRGTADHAQRELEGRTRAGPAEIAVASPFNPRAATRVGDAGNSGRCARPAARLPSCCVPRRAETGFLRPGRPS